MSTAPVVAFPAAQALKRNILAVASGKGGVGKTWFAVTLCHALSRRGKRVLLFDGDLGLANVDIQLGLTPDKDLGHVIDGQTSLQGAVTRLDLTHRLGSVLAAADAAQLVFAEAGVAAEIADGMIPFNPVVLARRLIAQTTLSPQQPIQKRGAS